MTLATKKKIADDVLLKVSRMKPVIKPTKPHKHAGYHELIILSKGLGYHTINDQNYEVKPMMGFYLKPGQVHCWNFTQISCHCFYIRLIIFIFCRKNFIFHRKVI